MNRARRLAESAVTSLVAVANQAAEAIAASAGPCRVASREGAPSSGWETISLEASAAEIASAVRELAAHVRDSGYRLFSDGGWKRLTPAAGLAVIVLTHGVAVRASRTGDIVSLEVCCRSDRDAAIEPSFFAVA